MKNTRENHPFDPFIIEIETPKEYRTLMGILGVYLASRRGERIASSWEIDDEIGETMMEQLYKVGYSH